jgi:hypothetical protein
MNVRIVKIDVIPTVVWDDGLTLTEVPVRPITIAGSQYWDMIHDGGLAEEFDLLTSKIISAYGPEREE